MFQLLLLALLIGWTVSFLGQLPVGMISITATQISIKESFSNAWKYSIGVTIIEMLYLRLVLFGIDRILGQRIFYLIFGGLSILLFFIMGVGSFVAATRQKGEQQPPLLTNSLNRFFLGAGMSALNPLQIPFWFVWSNFVLEKGLIQANMLNYELYILGTGFGTITGLAVYMYGGAWLIKKMNTNQKTLNQCIGALFILAAIAQAYKFLSDFSF